MQKQEAEILAHMIQDHKVREVKALKELAEFDFDMSMETDEERVKSLEGVRELKRKRVMPHRAWLREIAPLVGWTIKRFGDKRDVDPRTGIKGICITKFEEWI